MTALPLHFRVMKTHSFALSCVALCAYVGIGGTLLSGCKKSEPPNVAQNGSRRVELRVSDQGYSPPRIVGRPGEELLITVRYEKSAGECGREIVFPAQNVKKTLSEDKPTEIALKLPQEKGEVTFTCGMNMLRGAVVVE
ncbi:MAG TPA: cupredoxin domain-containing protein [Pseudomonadota bacterium]|nr:cupredoxin domain-containing protein [Pseudomonadota bacterium]